MEEIDIGMLKANGYDYIYGSIVSVEGKYIASLELNGRTLNSESSEALFNKAINLDKIENKTKVFKPYSHKNDPILKNILIHEKKKINDTKKTNKYLNLTVQKEYFTESQIKEIYNYPIVLGLSLLIFYLIKKLKE
jgi:hypothetical protein